MSQFTLTAAEDALVLDALIVKAAQYAALFGSSDPEMSALIAKVQSQLASIDTPAAETVVEETIVHEATVVEQVTETEVTA